VFKDFVNGEEAVDVVLLWRQADAVPGLAVVGLHVEAEHLRGPTVGVDQPDERVDKRGLARTVGAEQSEELPDSTVSERPSRACTSPYDLRSSRTSIAGAVIGYSKPTDAQKGTETTVLVEFYRQNRRR